MLLFLYNRDMEKIRAYLFDMDGTLADSENYYITSTISCFRERGIEKTFDEIRNALVGVTMDAAYDYVARVLGVDVEEGKRIYDDYYKRHPLYYKDYLFKESLEVIRTLKERGYKTALCTMNEKTSVDDFISCGFEGLFDFTVSFNDGVREKPYPDVYLKAMEALGVKPEETVVVEDSVSGIKAGKASGAYVIGCNEADIGTDLSEADKVIDNLLELL